MPRINQWNLAQQALAMTVDSLLSEGLPTDTTDLNDTVIALSSRIREAAEELAGVRLLTSDPADAARYIGAELLRRLLVEGETKKVGSR